MIAQNRVFLTFSSTFILYELCFKIYLWFSFFSKKKKRIPRKCNHLSNFTPEITAFPTCFALFINALNHANIIKIPNYYCTVSTVSIFFTPHICHGKSFIWYVLHDLLLLSYIFLLLDIERKSHITILINSNKKQSKSLG